MSLNLHHLRLFAAVVERRGFTRAAAALRLSQPAISKSLGELERGVGMPLLERSGRATRLTEAGEALYAHAREIFGAERSAERHLRELRGLERGILRIAATPTIATYVLPALLGRFHSLHPRVDFDTTMAHARTVARLLLEWRVDVALVEGPTADKRLEPHRWRDDELVVIGASDHRLTHDRGATVASLATETFVVPRRDS